MTQYTDKPKQSTAGQQKYMTFCSSCHGTAGTGNPALGAPDFTDGVWLHGSDAESMRDVIMSGRINQMPAQQNVLNEDRIRVVTAYVLSLQET